MLDVDIDIDIDAGVAIQWPEVCRPPVRIDFIRGIARNSTLLLAHAPQKATSIVPTIFRASVPGAARTTPQL